MLFRFVTKHTCDGGTHRQTGRHNYDPQDRASIASVRYVLPFVTMHTYVRRTDSHISIPILNTALILILLLKSHIKRA